jgi:low temperature requirement protein LtrA
VTALLVDYTGIWLAGTSGWRVHSPVHFAERHGLIVIVALGESIVAIGVGVAGQRCPRL